MGKHLLTKVRPEVMGETAKMLQNLRPTSLVLSLLHGSKANFYRHLSLKESTVILEQKKFDVLVSKAYHRYKVIYVAPKLHEIHKKKVNRIPSNGFSEHLNARALRPSQLRNSNTQEAQTHQIRFTTLILSSSFHADQLNQKWSINITYINIQKDVWYYLSSIMYLFSRLSLVNFPSA